MYRIFLKKDDDDDDEQVTYSEPNTGHSTEADNRRKSLQLDDSDEEEEELIEKEVLEKRKSCITPKEEFQGEGFLLKKPQSTNSWDKRYFRIKNGVLYWYVNERSRTCQNKIKIEDMEECMPDPATDSHFVISTKGKGSKKKSYKFDAATTEMRSLWLEALTKEIKALEDGQTEDDIQLSISSGGKEPLLKDFDAIRRREMRQKAKLGRSRTEIRQERRSLHRVATIPTETKYFETKGPPVDGVQGGCCGFFSTFFK